MVRPSASDIVRRLTHDLEGSFHQPTLPLPSPVASGNYSGTATLNLPDIVTLSLRQVMTPTTRLLGTVEWTNWSRFKDLAIITNGAGNLAVQAKWSDGWFFSVGGEYDYSPLLTLA